MAGELDEKAVIFDWSGTLSDSFHLFCDICAAMFKELGRNPISEDEIRKNFTLPYMKFWNKYFPDLSREKENELFDKYHKHRAKLYPGAKEVVSWLHSAGYKLFVMSSDPEYSAIPEIESAGFSKLFSEVVTDIHEKEPELRNLVLRNKLSKETTFYVGDTSGDIEAGKAVGLKTIGISWGFQHSDILKKSDPDFLIDDIKELEKLLQA